MENIKIVGAGQDTPMRLYAIDIETVSQGKRANEYTDNKSYKLGNVTDEDKKAKKLEEKRDAARGKHALHWSTGKIVSVALVDVYGDYEEVIMGHDEVEILAKLSDIIGTKMCKLIGKTSKNFDFPYLIGRYMANYMTVPQVLKESRYLYDVDEFFGRSAASGQRGTLDCYAHGVAYKNKSMDGSQVGNLYATIIGAEMKGDDVAAKAGWKQLHDYNLHDSKVVGAMAVLYYGPDRVGV